MDSIAYDQCDTYGRTEIIQLPENTNVINYKPSDAIQNCISVSLSKLFCHNRFLTIITGMNDQISWFSTTDAVQYTYTVPEGHYTNFTLQNELTTGMTGLETAATWTVTYDDLNATWSFVCSANASLLWATGNCVPQSLRNVVGFSATDTATGLTHNGDEISKRVPPYFIIESKILAGTGRRWGVQGDSSIVTGTRDIGFILPIKNEGWSENYEYEDISSYPEGSDNTYSYQGERTFSNIDIAFKHAYQPNDDQYVINRSPITIVLTFQCKRRFK